ncbi:MAG: flavodoxin family protein, partial [Deltaproteobacteria bacterium]|nr:flavodoxin family protein [Deltaproteobacteria bacterium]
MGWEVRGFVLREMDIPYCLGCFGCWVKTPGFCIMKDATRDIAGTFIRSDLAVLLTPVTFGGYSSELKKALDRMICLLSPFFRKVGGEVHHRPRYDRYPRWMALGALPESEPEEEEIFSRLVERNAINLYAPDHVSGILIEDQGDDEIRPFLQNLFEKVGVRK